MRRSRLVAIHLARADRPTLEARHGQVWDSDELARDFDVLAFGAPYVAVRRKTDNTLGSFEFQADPRFYFNFEADPEGGINKAASQPAQREVTPR